MSYSNTPFLPRKPAEYETRASQPSMTDLLQSLNIDEDPSRDYGQGYGRPRSIVSRPPQPDSTAFESAVRSRNNTVTSQSGAANATTYPSSLAQDSPGGRPYAGIRDRRSSPTKTPDMSPNSQKVARKPVDTTPTRRVYYSPDDLDELIPKGRPEPEQRANRPLPSPTYQFPPPAQGVAASSYDAYAPRDQYNPHTGPTAPRNTYSNYPGGYGGQQAEHDRQPQQQVNPYDMRPMGTQQPYGRSNSPTQRNVLRPMPAQSYPAYPSALQTNQELAPRTIYNMPGAPERQNSSPYRSQSSLSNHSQRSPDRENSYRHSNALSQSFQTARIPSPERTNTFTTPPLDVDHDRMYNASVPPAAAQARRGRQKGEIVAESDLPAMPLLFAESRHPDSDTTVPLMPQPQPNASPSRSPTRNSNILPNLSPRKRASFARAPDLLQSVKVLPIKPVKCPPLCLEERYHPFAFVKTNKFKIKVFPAQSTFVAGGEVFGHIDIVSEEGFRAQFGSTQVLVGEIGVEVIGYEEIQHAESGHNPRSFTFLFSRKVFQTLAETHPGRAAQEQILTSAVTNDPPPDQDGFRSASKGTSSFPFSFPLPVDAPSSADLNVARIKYLITGYATVKLQGSHEIMATSVPVRVVEAWDVGNPIYDEPIEAAQGRDIANYHEIAGTAQIPRSLYMEGETLFGNVRIANHSSKKIREIKFLLVNRITFFGDGRSPANELNPPNDFSIEQTATGHVEAHIIGKGDHESWNFSIHIPPERCLTVRNTALFEVTPEVLIKISTGPLQKSTRLYIPQISIACPDSMVNNQDRIAPTSAMMRWATLPSLYRFQRVIDGATQTPEKGFLDVTDLITYHTAQERVALLSTSD